MRLGLVLLLPSGAEAACVAYAEQLVVGRHPRVVVGPGRRPHVTLLHVESDEDPALLWREAREAIARSIPLELLSLGLLRYDVPYNAPAATAATMAWLIIPCSAALRAAEQQALALPFVGRATVTTSNGPRFQPHVTLAIWDGEHGPEGRVLPKAMFGGAPIEARLALGIIGSNGVYERSLFEI